MNDDILDNLNSSIVKKLFNALLFSTDEESLVAKQKIVNFLNNKNLNFNDDLYIASKNEISSLKSTINFLNRELTIKESLMEEPTVEPKLSIREHNFKNWNYIADLWTFYKKDNPRIGSKRSDDGFRFGWYKEVIDFIDYPFYGRVSSWNKKKCLTKMPDHIVNDVKQKLESI